MVHQLDGGRVHQEPIVSKKIYTDDWKLHCSQQERLAKRLPAEGEMKLLLPQQGIGLLVASAKAVINQLDGLSTQDVRSLSPPRPSG
jgi:hypothetical protein